MTKEEREKAIKNLEFSAAVGIRPSKEAFKVALEALKQEPCEDAVSRKRLKECFHKNVTNGEVFDDLIDMQPSVTPTREQDPKWIPVSEGTPKELTPVNITWVNRNPESYYKDIKDKPFSATGVYYKGEWYWYSSTCEDYLAEYGRCEWDKIDASIEITAWMPLPEPYKESEQHG